MRLYHHAQPGLLRYATLLSGQDAEDVCAETWAQAVRDLASFQGDLVGFRGWLATIARHRAIDLARKHARRPVAPLDPAALVALDARHSPSGEEETITSLSTDDALRLIASLPRDQAEAVYLRVVMGLDARSAGRVLGKRAGAVRTAGYRGLKALKLRLSSE